MTCNAVPSRAMLSKLTFTAQYCGLIFKSLGEHGSMNGWHIFRSRVLRFKKNPSCAWVAVKNSAIICREKKYKYRLIKSCKTQRPLNCSAYRTQVIHFTISVHLSTQECKWVTATFPKAWQVSIFFHSPDLILHLCIFSLFENHSITWFSDFLISC